MSCWALQGGYSADAYSWSMLMWFMLALEPPFGMYSNKMIFDRVFRRGSRPAIVRKWTQSIGDIMKYQTSITVHCIYKIRNGPQ